MEAELLEAFRERRWRAARDLGSSSRDSLSRFLGWWAGFELGEIGDLGVLRELMAEPPAWALHDTWGLWPFRKRVGVDALVEWGLLGPLVDACWKRFELVVTNATDAQFEHRNLLDPAGPMFQPAFVRDWVADEMLGFCHGLLREAVPPTPWHLGSAKPILDRQGERAVRLWARRRLEETRLDSTARSALAALDDPPSLRRFQTTGEPVYRAITALASKAAPTAVLLQVAASLNHEPIERQRELAVSLDDTLLRLDLETRLREQKIKSPIQRVLFRATPRRALEVAVARLESGQFGTLARYSTQGMPGEVWTEGSLDEALAAVPEAHFSHAVVALRRA